MQFSNNIFMGLCIGLVATFGSAVNRVERIERQASLGVESSQVLFVASAPVGATIESLKHASLHADIKQKWGLSIARHKNIVGELVQTEGHYAGSHYPVYHAQKHIFRPYQDFLRLLYAWEFKTTVPDDFTFLRWWHGAPVKADVQSYLDSKKSISDHEAAVSDVLLSVNFALFGNVYNPGESSFYYFLNNASMTDFASRIPQLLEKAMKHYGFNPVYAQKIVECGKEITTPEGNLLQILIPKTSSAASETNTLVDRVLYASEIGGSPIEDRYHYAGYTKSVVAGVDYSPDKGRYVRSSGILQARLERSRNFKARDFDRMQGRLYLSKDDALNPASGIKIKRYTTVPADKMIAYKAKLEEIFKQMVAEKGETAKS